MPNKISMDVPPTLKNNPGLKSIGSETTSQAYLLLKQYVSWGMGVTLFIDSVLSNLYQNRDYLLSHLGEQIPADNGYVVFNTNSDGGHYFYLVKTNSNITNIYLDWQKIGGAFKGKVKFVSDTNIETKEAVVFYDQTVSQPFLDIYLKFDTGNSEGIENFRVKLIKIGEGEVIAKSKVDLDPSSLTNGKFISSWNIVGYAKSNDNGGVYAWTIGRNEGSDATNIVIIWTNNFIPGPNIYYNSYNYSYVSNSFTFSNYVYEEYFNSSGQLLWNLAKGDVLYFNTNLIYTTNYSLNITNGLYQSFFTTNVILFANDVNSPITNLSVVSTNINPQPNNILNTSFLFEVKIYSNIVMVDPNICNTNGQKPLLSVELSSIEPLDSAVYTNISGF